MATVSDLLTKLQKRLGITSPSARESDRLTEALYAAISRASEDGIAGIGQHHLTGATYGSEDVTVSTHSANTSSFTPSSVPTGTRAGDIIKIGSDLYTLYAVGATFDVGAPIQSDLTGSTVTVYRRTVPLPHTGPVYRVWSLTNNGPLEHLSDGFAKYRFDTGTPAAYEVGYDRDDEQQAIHLWPIPTGAHRIVISQRIGWDTLSTSTDLPFPVSTQDAILSDATAAWRRWQTGGVSPMELEASRQDVTSNPTKKR